MRPTAAAVRACTAAFLAGLAALLICPAANAALEPLVSGGSNLPVADLQWASSGFSFTGAATKKVSDLDVTIRLSHGRPNDLLVWLRWTSEDGNTQKDVVLMSGDCSTTAITGREFYFDDEAGSPLPRSTACLDGSFQPTADPDYSGADLWDFENLPVAGTWELFVTDQVAGFSGEVLEWELTIQTDRWTNDDWSGPLALPTPGVELTTLAANNTNQTATLETVPSKSGAVDEYTQKCGNSGYYFGKTVWYSLALPGSGSLRLDANVLPDSAPFFDWDWAMFDPVVLLARVDPADGKLVPVDGGSPLWCSDTGRAGVTETLEVDGLAPGSYRIGVGGWRRASTPPGERLGSAAASDGTFELRGQFRPASPPPPPTTTTTTTTTTPAPDGDKDGIPDAFDRCPTAKPTKDADRNGCQDITPTVRGDLKWEWAKWRRGSRLRGAALKNVVLKHAPAGATVRVRCSDCRVFRNKRRRAFRAFAVRARRSGSLRLDGLTNTLIPRGKRLVVSVRRPGHIGRRFVVRMGARKPVESESCTAELRADKRVACTTAG